MENVATVVGADLRLGRGGLDRRAGGIDSDVILNVSHFCSSASSP
ncbi:Uncharacterised protein [Mycobacteroides abscessus subsp. massiliense]|nr:Uncharacterised protein [Mycobacteroides abscessus subsp. massiliense]